MSTETQRSRSLLIVCGLAVMFVACDRAATSRPESDSPHEAHLRKAKAKPQPTPRASAVKTAKAKPPAAYVVSSTRRAPAKPKAPPEPVAAKTSTETTVASTADFARLLKDGRAANKAKDYEEAIDNLEQALEAKPRHIGVRIDLARAYVGLKQADKARPHAKMAVDIVPTSSYAWNTLGRVELLDRQFAAAATAFKRATKQNPKNLYAWNNLGLALMRARKLVDAVVAFKVATTLAGTTDYMWNNLGTAYERLRDAEHARGAYEQAAAMGSFSAKASLRRMKRKAQKAKAAAAKKANTAASASVRDETKS